MESVLLILVIVVEVGFVSGLFRMVSLMFGLLVMCKSFWLMLLILIFGKMW